MRIAQVSFSGFDSSEWSVFRSDESSTVKCTREFDASKIFRNLVALVAVSQIQRGPLSWALAATRQDTFDEVPAASSGNHWVHDAGKSSAKYLPETSGAGCAFLDFDQDGWMDIYLVNSGKCEFYDPPRPLRNALYRNNRDGTFTDVTETAGVPGTAYGMGVAVGDYNNDGFPDLYVTQYPRNILYRNNGDGTFTDMTEKRASRRAAGAPALSGSTTTTMESWTFSCASLGNSTLRLLALRRREGRIIIAIPRS